MTEQTSSTPARQAFAVVDPPTDQVIARYPTTTDDELRETIACAERHSRGGAGSMSANGA